MQTVGRGVGPRAGLLATEPTSICVLEGHDHATWAARHADGEQSSGLPFGIDALTSLGFSLRHSDAVWHGGKVWQWACDRSRPLPYQLRPDGAVAQVLTALPQIRRSSACLSMFEHQGLAYAAIRQGTGGHLPPLVMMTCWLAETVLKLGRRRLALYRKLCSEASIITVFSSNQVPLLSKLLRLPAERFVVVTFGVDTDFYHPGPETPVADNLVAVVGMDTGRDWPTFARAAALTPEMKYVLATRPYVPMNQHFPDNVVGRGMLDHNAYRSLLRTATLSVVPTHPLRYPTGQTVLLESLACGCPAVAARTDALSEYEPTDCVLTYDVGDPESLALAIRTLASDSARRQAMSVAGREVAVTRYDRRLMWRQIANLLEACVSHPNSGS